MRMVTLQGFFGDAIAVNPSHISCVAPGPMEDWGPSSALRLQSGSQLTVRGLVEDVVRQLTGETKQDGDEEAGE